MKISGVAVLLLLSVIVQQVYATEHQHWTPNRQPRSPPPLSSEGHDHDDEHHHNHAHENEHHHNHDHDHHHNHDDDHDHEHHHNHDDDHAHDHEHEHHHTHDHANHHNHDDDHEHHHNHGHDHGHTHKTSHPSPKSHKNRHGKSNAESPKPSPQVPEIEPGVARCLSNGVVEIAQCVQEIAQSFIMLRPVLGQDCCSAIRDIDQDCQNTIFGAFSNPFFNLTLQLYCTMLRA